MADEVADLKERVRRLELVVRDLTDQIEKLSRYTIPRAEHPSDNAAIRQKVTYDWQA